MNDDPNCSEAEGPVGWSGSRPVACDPEAPRRLPSPLRLPAQANLFVSDLGRAECHCLRALFLCSFRDTRSFRSTEKSYERSTYDPTTRAYLYCVINSFALANGVPIEPAFTMTFFFNARARLSLICCG